MDELQFTCPRRIAAGFGQSFALVPPRDESQVTTLVRGWGGNANNVLPVSSSILAQPNVMQSPCELVERFA